MAKKKATKKKATRTKKKTTKKKSTRKSNASPKARKPASNKRVSARASGRETHDYEGWDTFTAQQQRVIRAYEHLPIPSKVCKQCKVSRGSYYQWLGKYPLFKAAIAKAERISIDNAEAVAMEVGIHGRNELQIANGQVVMSEFDEDGNRYGNDEDGNPILKPLVRRVRDVGMLKTILAAKKPEEYGRKQVQLTGKDGGKIQTENTTTIQLTEEQLRQLPDDMLESVAAQAADDDE